MGVKTSRLTRNSKTTVNAGHSLDYRTTAFVDEKGAARPGVIPPENNFGDGSDGDLDTTP
jgi:hypothetical protein|tara:strand:- start:142 stop:321 length:180 start_codon:yes stop_codon:yes gene_type:complete